MYGIGMPGGQAAGVAPSNEAERSNVAITGPPPLEPRQDGQSNAFRSGVRRGAGPEPAAPMGGVGFAGTAPVVAAPVQLQASGQAAVEYSLGLSEMKTASTVGGTGTGQGAAARVVAGKTFMLVNGVWNEAADKSDAKGGEQRKKTKTLKIKYLSDAYFEVVRLRADLKSVFALGERVELDINDYRVVIGPEGEEKIAAAVLEELKKK